MSNYYDNIKITPANSRDLLPRDEFVSHFPTEGLFLGDLYGNGHSFPALFDIREINGLCLLYKDERQRCQVNSLIERLVWRIAITMPPNLCDILLYNGGNPGDAFSTHTRIDKNLYGNRMRSVFFDGCTDEFMVQVNAAYASIVDRMSTIRCAGKKDLVELNESLGLDARLKHQFIILTDFPRHLKTSMARRLMQIIEAGRPAGIHVIMSWDMNADFEDAGQDYFDPGSVFSKMELLVPNGETFRFQNTGHDDAFNCYQYAMDSVQMDVSTLERCIQYINVQCELAKKLSKPSILKQDFMALMEAPYEPAFNDLCVTFGRDVRDRHEVPFKLNSVDFLHGFILGQSGSGKSALLNNIIASIVLKYSPEDVMLYLMDFKGVEFNYYKGLKHTKAVLVDNSDPQMTLEVLNELKDEYDRRQRLFGKEQVKRIDTYNRLHPDNRMQHIVFIADECQSMFRVPSGDSELEQIIQRKISEILITIARLGRNAGIHMLLSTQQLSGTNIADEILENLTECMLMMSAPADSNRLVPDSSDMTSVQMTGIACYYHKREFQSQVQTFYATDEELKEVIALAQQKAAAFPGNGEHYFCGSSFYRLADSMDLLSRAEYDYPFAIVGKQIGVNKGMVAVSLHRDYLENILIFGENKEEQSVGVAMNALASLIKTYSQKGIDCQFLVIDCLVNQNVRYKNVLERWGAEGLCRLIPRQQSGAVLKDLVDLIARGTVQPTFLVIIGQERFIEMKNNMPLIGSSVSPFLAGMGSFEIGSIDPLDELDVDESVTIPDFTEEQRQIVNQMCEVKNANDPFEEDVIPEEDVSISDKMTFRSALSFILDSGPICGVHTLMLVNNPENIMFGDVFAAEGAELFRHKIMLRSENKYLSSLRFSHPVDLQILSDKSDRMRAYYYPDGDEPVLFTPFVMPDAGVLLENVINN